MWVGRLSLLSAIEFSVASVWRVQVPWEFNGRKHRGQQAAVCNESREQDGRQVLADEKQATVWHSAQVARFPQDFIGRRRDKKVPVMSEQRRWDVLDGCSVSLPSNSAG